MNNKKKQMIKKFILIILMINKFNKNNKIKISNNLQKIQINSLNNYQIKILYQLFYIAQKFKQELIFLM